MDNNKILLFLGDVVPYKSFKFRNDLQTVINLECPIIKGGIPEEGKSISFLKLPLIFGENLLVLILE